MIAPLRRALVTKMRVVKPSLFAPTLTLMLAAYIAAAGSPAPEIMPSAIAAAASPRPAPRATRQAPSLPTPDTETAYMCPMHPDYTSDKDGKCPRCGMNLVLGAPLNMRDYRLEFKTVP